MVRRRKGIVAGVIAVAAAAVVTVIFAVTTAPGSRPPSLPPSGIMAAVSIEPTTALFGDPLVARVEVLLDRRRVDPSTVVLHGNFAPYTVAMRSRVRDDIGKVTRLTYSLRLRCLVERCLPPDPRRGGRQAFVLPSPHLSFERSTGEGSLVLALPAVEVGSRLTPQEASLLDGFDAAPFHASAGLGTPTYAVSPGLLVALLLSAAALLIAASVWLVLRFGRRPKAPVPEPPPPVVLTPLERALVAAERARARGSVPDEREALEHLALELRRSGAPELAVTARGLAWSEAGPVPTATLELSDEVRTLIELRRDGHGA